MIPVQCMLIFKNWKSENHKLMILFKLKDDGVRKFEKG